MNPLTTSVFDLPDRLWAKADPALIAVDEQHFAAMAESLEQRLAELSDRLDAERKAPGGVGQAAMDRDEEIHRLTARLRTLRRYGLDLCLGRMVSADDPEPVYVGRLGLTDSAGRRLLVDWRSPGGRTVLRRDARQPDGSDQPPPVPLDPATGSPTTGTRCSPRTASRGTPRSTTSPPSSPAWAATGRPGCATCSARSQADQDAIIRAGSRGALVVDGGPGTGKTVVALHRTAYLLYSDPRLGHRRGGVLIVGPHQPYLAYVADVLPSLGEDDVQTCTLRDLVAEGASAAVETDPDVARLKSSASLVQAIEAAVRFYEEPPTEGDDGHDRVVRHPAERRRLGRGLRGARPGTPHNEAREQIWAKLLDDPDRQVRRRRTG